MFNDDLPEKEKPALARQCQERARSLIKGVLSVKKQYAKTELTATFITDGNQTTITVSGRVAQTLRALVDKGAKGITALEMSSWALRLGAYVHILRELGLRDYIITEREEHEDGWHGRYILATPVIIH